ncbi:MAG TPA: hypothetical protein VLA89_15625 [Gemmatimonadales bacterium]|nr:hypothetical protein [Gemmatimonadales bacterium]
MAVIKQGGSNPYQGKVMTTMGYKDPRPLLCFVCGQRKEGLFTINANGQQICSDCAGPKNAGALKGVCCEGECACGAE